MTENLSPQFGRNYLYYGHANGPSHKIDWSDSEYPENLPSYSADPSNSRIYHSSSHPFKPGDIVQPGMSKRESAESQGLFIDDGHERDEIKDYYNDPANNLPMAWASFHSGFATNHAHTFEVEPLDSKHNTHDVETDPHNTDTNEMISPTGYRVVQEVTPNGRK